MRQIIRALASVFAVLTALSGQAAVVSNLYDEQLLVESQSRTALKQGAGLALEQVFVRVSGRRQVADNPVVAEALAAPEPFMTQYRYQRSKNDEGEDELMLKLSFSPRQVNATLQSAGLPIWSANRPAVLVWLVADTIEGRKFVGADADAELLTALHSEAQRRGVVVQMPLFDLADSASLSVKQAWEMSVDDIQQASSRYSTPFILMGRVSQFSTGQWIGSWVLLQGAESLRLDSEGLTATDVLAAPIDYLADMQAATYSVSAGAGSSANTTIHVSGVNSFASYASLVTYLEGLAVIQHANTVWLNKDELILELVLNDDMEKVRRFLTLDGRLLESANVSQSLPVSVRGYYKWTGRNQ
ncbi:Uncharacterised protein [Zhongshania aliphaticivorans]|uniref:DUF2066 domain-containing protein n=1 Tax=Zhongshania aliphaticivorans TaxID=1470434 RepID=A0A5S9MZV7_9GAMM|nr:DUF2066 domain-containing protein [Zhongshania aliphaticivorans]CAA0082835.1 Uncharacterised protein [Zhongshania aliphaticivorans]CAA0083888.1 Uncharacterised protein [Zhongshania aliphaticivorans]